MQEIAAYNNIQKYVMARFMCENLFSLIHLIYCERSVRQIGWSWILDRIRHMLKWSCLELVPEKQFLKRLFLF